MFFTLLQLTCMWLSPCFIQNLAWQGVYHEHLKVVAKFIFYGFTNDSLEVYLFFVLFMQLWGFSNIFGKPFNWWLLVITSFLCRFQLAWMIKMIWPLITVTKGINRLENSSKEASQHMSLDGSSSRSPQSYVWVVWGFSTADVQDKTKIFRKHM